MSTQSDRSRTDIDLTHKELEEIRSKRPGTIFAYVAGLALNHDDPLDYWGQRCDVAFMARNLEAQREMGTNAFYETYRAQVDHIARTVLRCDPENANQADINYFAYMTIENAAFHIRYQISG